MPPLANHLDVSVYGLLCTCNRPKYEKHAGNCPARIQCRGCSRNVYEPHEDGCTWTEVHEDYEPTVQ